MRFAIYTGTFIKDQDGVARATYRLVDSLLEEGHQVLVLSPAITPQKRQGLKLCRLPSIPLLLYPDYRMAYPSGIVIRALKRFEPDLIHITTPDFIGFQLMLYSRITRVPIISIHHTDFPNYLSYFRMGFAKEFCYNALVWFYNHTDRTFAPTEGIRGLLEYRGAKRMGVWGRGIDRTKFHPKFRSEQLRKIWGIENKKVIVYAGRFVWYKDLRIFYKVYRKFKNRLDKDVAFMLIGSGPIEDTLKRRMPKAIFPGYLHENALSTAFASGDLFLFPSVTETFGQVIQEALSSGLPAIVSDQGGCQEIVRNSGAGVVVEGKNVENFYQAAVDLIDNPEKYQKMRELGLKYAETQTWDIINSRLIRKYRIIATNLSKHRIKLVNRIPISNLFASKIPYQQLKLFQEQP